MSYRLLQKKIRDAAKSGTVEMDALVREFLDLGEAHQIRKSRTARQLFMLMSQSPELNDNDIQAFTSGFSSRDADYLLVRNAEKFGRLAGMASFREEMARRTHKKMLLGERSCLEWVLQDKKTGYRFADLLKVRRPAAEFGLSVDELEFRPGTVIKPVNSGGSRGVYMVLPEGTMFDVRRSERFDGRDKLLERIAQDVAEGEISGVRFVIEELIRDDTTHDGFSEDWKFYCFYGRIELVGRLRRHPSVVESWMSADGTHVDRGFAMSELVASDSPPPRPSGLGEADQPANPGTLL